ncbi:MAG: hypothetical protein DCE90_12875 [Pseudanabaena sp.]|nr:MAG: hypothetical protein DCE90_12875 [Pseudanabaena sp.]
MASYPWVLIHERQQQNIEDFPHLKPWLERTRERPAFVRAYQQAEPFAGQPTITEESRKILFGQTSKDINR